MTRRLLWTVTVAGGSFAGGLAGNWLLVPRAAAVAQSPSPLPAPPAPADHHAQDPLTPDRFARVASRVLPAVVAVDAVKRTVVAASPLADGGKGKPNEESGSGVIVRLDGYRGQYAVTNNHVIAGATAAEITVTLADGRIFRPEQVLTDPESDVAILRLPGDDLPAADLGDSDGAAVGNWVLAFGSPFGLHRSVTHGIVSARDRGQIRLGDTIRIKDFLQTDAPINPGSSGGPLVDLNGAVVGINTAIASPNGGNTGVSFSIPINLVRRVARELLGTGKVARGYLGLQLGSPLEPADALRLGLTRVWGATVESVHPGGPAAAGGLRPGDVVLKLDAVDVRDENHLINLIGTLPVGHRARLTVWRDRQPRAVEVTVGDWATVRAR